jgi:hypothetical protein
MALHPTVKTADGSRERARIEIPPFAVPRVREIPCRLSAEQWDADCW